MPASASWASVIWRCEVDGGWTTIVWTLPSEAVSSVRVRASMTARPAARPPATSTASIPPNTSGRNWRAATACCGWLGQAGIEDTSHAVLTLEPGGECRRGPGVALGAHGEGQDAAQDEEGVERADRGAGVDLDLLDLAHELIAPGDDAGDDVAVAGQELGRRFHDQVRPELERPADVRRGERVVDEVGRAVPRGRRGRPPRGRSRPSSGWRWSRRRRRASARRRRRRSRPSRSVRSAKTTSTPNLANVSTSWVRVEP